MKKLLTRWKLSTAYKIALRLFIVFGSLFLGFVNAYAQKCIQSVAATGNQSICRNQTPIDLVATVTADTSIKGKPVLESYQWYSNSTNSNSGGTAISGATNATYSPSTAAAGTFYFYCVIVNTNGAGTCAGGSNVSNVVTVTVRPPVPFTVDAGSNQTVCGNQVTLNAQTLTTGQTGLWSIMSGGFGTFADNASSISTFTGTAGTAYLLKWTVTGDCFTTYDSVTISLTQAPTTANAGFDRGGTATCGLTTLSLAGNTPSVGTGQWSIISGTGGNIASNSNPSSLFTGVAGNSYTLRWTISNSPCSSSVDEVNVVFNISPKVANIGYFGSLCAASAEIFIDTSETGVNYQIKRINTLIGTPTAGTGDSLIVGTVSNNGTYTVLGTNAVSGCSTPMNGSVVFGTTNLPGIFTVSGGGSVCEGGTGLPVSLSGSQIGVSYQLFRNGSAVGGIVAGTGTVLNFGLFDSASTYTVVGYGTPGCQSNMTGSAIIIVNIPPVINLNPQDISIIYGDSARFISSASGSSISYQWQSSINQGLNWTDIPAATDSFYSISNPIVSMNGSYYRVIVSGLCPSDTSISVLLTVGKAALTITADSAFKTYGDPDPVLNYTPSGELFFGDTYDVINSVIINTDTGKNAIAGNRVINISGGIADNYLINHVNGILTVSKRPISIKANSRQKIYGETDPELTYQLISGNLVYEDMLTGFLERSQGESVGKYAINQGTLDNNNYSISYTADSLEITPLAVTVSAVGKSKTYGDVDPVLTFTSVPAEGSVLSNGDTVSFTGSLTRDAGENIGKYAITQGSVSNSNYSINYIADSIEITPLAVTVSAAAKSKTYGDVDPALTFTSVPAEGSVLSNGDTVSFTGSLTRDVGENIGKYAINQGTLDNNNYSISYTADSLEITPLAVTVSAAAKSKTYGDVDPALTFTSVPAEGSVLSNGDTVSFTGALTRNAGENVGQYAINQGTLGNNNYNITYAADSLTINKLNVSVTAAAKAKTYGDVDPALTFTSVPAEGSVLSNGDTVSFTGSLTRDAGENIGKYAITQGSVSNSNYSINYIADSIEITPLAVTVSAAAKSKTYGDVDPVLTFTSVPAEGSVLSNGDTVSFTGSLTRDVGENIGKYAITQGSVSNSNYSINYIADSIEITPLAVTVSAEGKSKTYGDVDPALTFTSVPAEGSVLSNGNTVSFTGALSRDAGENIGKYAINQGTLDNNNYSISYTADSLEITPLAVTVSAAAKSKTYGDNDPVLTFTSVPAEGSVLSNGDTVSFTGSLTRDAGENIGKYAITQGSVSNSNYSINYIADSIEITPLAVTVSAVGKSKTYGDVDPVLTFTSVPAEGSVLSNGDTVSFTGSLTRDAGENIGKYAINQGTLDNNNYSISYTADSLEITPLAVTVSAEGKSKTYGDVDPALTFTSVPAEGSVLSNGNTVSFTGALSRDAGENIGKYAINQGTLDNNNYSISYTADSLEITPLAVAVSAEGKSKTYGDVDPVLTFTSIPAEGSVLSNGDTISFAGSLTRNAGESIGNYAILQGSVANNNYAISYTGANLTIGKIVVSITAAAKSKTYGDNDPVLTFTSVPAEGSVLSNGDTVSFTGSLTRDAGENIGKYAITQGSVSNSNYSINYIADSIEITPLAVTVSAAAKSKTYGDVDPALTFTSVPAEGSVLSNGDTVSFTGSLTRDVGENIGKYAITQGSVSNSNYSINYIADSIDITPLVVTVSADGKSKTYGDVDPVLTFTSVPAEGSVLSNGDTVSFTGSLTRDAGENIGKYAINQGTLDNNNYSISYTADSLEITPLAVTVSAEGKSKTYGDVDPALTFTSVPAEGSVLSNGDTVSFSGSLTRDAGENIGKYAITQGSVSNSNYSINYIADSIEITPLAVTVSAVGKSKTYGDIDPVLTFTSVPAEGSVLSNGDTVSFTGSLQRVAGENVGNYAISQGTLGNNNYNITYTADSLTINKLNVSVTAAAKAKTYGDVDPALTFTSVPAEGSVLPNGDTVSFTGSLTRDVGESIGSYAILQGSVANNNYAISYIGANLTIGKIVVSITAAAKSKTYGDNDPALTFTSVPAEGSALSNGNTVSFTGVLSRDAGENIGKYAINQGTLVNNNYSISYTADSLEITPLAVTVSAAAKSKTYGDVDPVLTFTSVPAEGSVLSNGDTVSFTGSLTRDAGENIGKYAITQGSVSNSNYSINYIADSIEITPLAVTVSAEGKSKIYGDVDPALTFTSVPAEGSVLSNGDTVSFTGSLTRDVGESIGSYAILQGSVANNNYAISYIGANLTIGKIVVAITAAAKLKTYGDVDPALTFTSVPAEGSVLPNGDTVSFTGSLTRDVGESIGSYAILQGSVANNNYAISYIGANLTIGKIVVSITAAAKSKTYGDVDPALIFTSVPAEGSVLSNGDTVSFTGVLSRDAGENIGKYAITQGSVSNSNYSINYIADSIEITPLAVTVSAVGKSKTYGDVDPALTFTSVPAEGSVLPNGDTVSFSGSLTRDVGESIGSYAILQGSVANNNYAISYIGANLTIGKIVVSITAAAKSKTYGDVDPALTFTSVPAEGSVLSNGDTVSFTGSLTRDSGENIGKYAITQGSVSNSNYSVNYVADSIEITPLAVTVSAEGKSKIYGDVDPALTFTSVPAEGSVLSNGDTVSFTGSLTRDVGESIGSYAILQGSVANNNYAISYTGANLTIGKIVVAITAAAKSKTYGDVDPALTFTSVPVEGSVLSNGDTVSFTGSLTRDAGENIGKYAITQGSVSNSNYSINYITDSIEITPLAVTVSADGKSKTYGDVDPALTFTSVPAEGSVLPNGDTVSFIGALSRDAGENIGKYAITQGSVSNSNYSINYIADSIEITPLAVTVSAAAKSKTYGDVDPALTFTSAPAEGSVLPNGDTVSFTGSLTRDVGESIGSYAILQGSVANNNYAISYTGANLTIGKIVVAITAAAKSKTYGDNDPALTFTSVPAEGSVLSNGDTVSFTGSLTRDAGENIGKYAITQGSVSNSNYSINYITDSIEITPLAVTVSADGKSKTYGDVDPALTFTSVPAEGSVLSNGNTVSFTGSLQRVAGENVGNYAINQGTLDNNNYNITYTADSLTINKLYVSVTVAAMSKTYGDVDPSLTFVSVPAEGSALSNGQIMNYTGSLVRVPGEDVGIYPIEQGSLNNSNYNINYISNNLEISPLTVTVSADGKSKTYGDVDPALTFVSIPSVGVLLANGQVINFAGSLERLPGEEIGSYQIEQGTVSNTNYTINYVSDSLIITPLAVSVFADSKSKTYGDVDPSLTFVSLPAVGTLLANGQAINFAGSLTRLPGEAVGSYQIDQGTVSNTNYTINYVADSLVITPLAVIVTADSKSKTYGDVDPSLTFVSVPAVGTLLANGQVINFAGSLTRLTGEDVGSYEIEQGTVSNTNYTINYVADSLVITPLAVIVTADSKSKTYGDIDPSLTFVSVPAVGTSLANGQVINFAGTLARLAGEDVGIYPIEQGTVSNSNYSIIYTADSLEITPLAVTVSADGKSKTYGDIDPSLTFVSVPAEGSALSNGQIMNYTGSLVRVPGEDVGIYPIEQGSLNNSNYNINFISNNLEISPLTVTVSADGKSKTYGDVDPALTFVSVPSVGVLLANGQVINFAGSLERLPGEEIGSYQIEQGTVSNTNYTINYVSDSLIITPLAVSVFADSKSKTYGDVDPSLTFVSLPAVGTLLANGQAINFAGSLTRLPGEDVGSYEIEQGTVSNINYTINYVADSLVINPLAVTVLADSKTKTYGDVDPSLTFVSVPAVGTLLANGQAINFAGSLARLTGEDVGSYEIEQGTVSNTNYTINYVADSLVITPLAVTVTADSKSKTYGDIDPSLTFVSVPAVGTSLANGQVINFAGTLARLAGEDVGIYPIEQGTVSNSNYSIIYTADSLEITPLAVTVSADGKSKTYGDVDPSLTFVSVPPIGTVLSNGEVISFNGGISRNSGESIGKYAIVQGSLNNMNLRITYLTDTLVINPLSVIVIASTSTKIYGDLDPSLTFVSVPAVGTVLPNGQLISYSGSLARNPGEDVGNYQILQGSLKNDNYVISYLADSFTITPLNVTVKTDRKIKVFGNIDPLLTYTSIPAVGTMLPNSIMVNFTGTLVRDTGEAVGNYKIRQGSIANANYLINYESDSLAITPFTILLTARPQTKVYGDIDPSFTYVSLPAVGDTLANGDVIVFSGSLSRTAGEDVGAYSITLGTLSNPNYNISFVSDFLEISPLSVNVTGVDSSKIYGKSDPIFRFVSVPSVGSSLPNGLTVGFSGQLERETGESIGTYSIRQGSLNNSNYSINFDSSVLTIVKRTVIVSADAGQFKIYGSTDPLLTYSLSSDGIAPFDEFFGYLGRDTGEAVGTYPINVGSLNIINKSSQASAMTNYDFSFVPADFTVIPAYSTTILLRGKPSVYYRDSITLTAIIRPMNNQSPLSGQVEFQIGGQSYGFVQATQMPDSATGILQAILPVKIINPPGAYTISTLFSSNNSNYSGSKYTKSLTVLPRPTISLNPSGYYTGEVFAWAQDRLSDRVSVKLRAGLKDSLEYGVALPEAKVTFYLVENGALKPIDGAADLPVILSDATDSSAGYSEALVDFKIGGAKAVNYLIAVGVSGNYSNRVADGLSYSLITVARKLPGGYTVGGSRIANDSSFGILAGAKKLNSDFQFDGTTGSNGLVTSGKIKVIIRSDRKSNGEQDSVLHTYMVEANALQSMIFNSPTASITIDGSATLFELGNDLKYLPLGSNLPVKLKAFQNACDQEVSIEVLNGINQLLYSSSWNGINTQLTSVDSLSRIYLAGGGICDGDTAIRPEDIPGLAIGEGKVNIFIAPNPSNYEFTVIPGSNDFDYPIELRVIDQQGRLVEKFVNLKSGYPVKLGAAYRSGIYYVQLIQSGNMLSRKLLKL